MAKFNFKLQSLLNVKAHQEDNLKNELGKAITALEAEKQKLHKLESKKDNYIIEFNQKVKKTTVVKIKEYNGYISFLTAQIRLQKENVNCASRNVDKVREELIQIVKEREILDKLKEKKLEDYRLDEKIAEQKLNDEIVSFRTGEKNTANKIAGD